MRDAAPPGCSPDHWSIDHAAISRAYGVEAERVEDPAKLTAAPERCFNTAAAGRPSVLDVTIARRYGGADSTWFDFSSIARGLPRQT
jgi:thiamine pyrophosphate-dependent acetolactate synthase large subunit-like protein